MESLRVEIVAAVVRKFPIRDFYLVETVDSPNQEKNLVMVLGDPLKASWIPTGELQKAWHLHSYDPTHVLVMNGDSDAQFRIQLIPKAWIQPAVKALAATADLLCKVWAVPKAVAMIMAVYKCCVCETGAATGYAVAKGHLWCVKKAFESDQIKLSGHELCLTAASFGQLEILEYLHIEQKIILFEELYTAAAQSGKLTVSHWLDEHECPWDSAACEWAAFLGHLEILRWALETGHPHNIETVCRRAAMGGHLEVVEWLHRFTHSQDLLWPHMLCQDAVSYGHWELFEWLQRCGGSYDPLSCMRICSTTGALSALKRFHGRGYPLVKDYASLAACYNSPRLLQWLYKEGCPHPELSVRAYARMAEAGNLEILELLYEQEGACSQQVQMAMYTRGTPEVREWAKELVIH